MQFFDEAIESPWTLRYKLVADEQSEIEGAMQQMVRSAAPAIAMRTQLHCASYDLILKFNSGAVNQDSRVDRIAERCRGTYKCRWMSLAAALW